MRGSRLLREAFGLLRRVERVKGTEPMMKVGS
jgi:hypothetical protein